MGAHPQTRWLAATLLAIGITIPGIPALIAVLGKSGPSRQPPVILTTLGQNEADRPDGKENSHSRLATVKSARAFPVGSGDLQWDIRLGSAISATEPGFSRLDLILVLHFDASISSRALVQVGISRTRTERKVRFLGARHRKLRIRSILEDGANWSVRLGPLPLPTFGRVSWRIKTTVHSKNHTFHQETGLYPGTSERPSTNRVDLHPRRGKVSKTTAGNPVLLSAYDQFQAKTPVKEARWSTDLLLSESAPSDLSAHSLEPHRFPLIFARANGVLCGAPLVLARSGERSRASGFSLVLPEPLQATANNLSLSGLLEITVQIANLRAGLEGEGEVLHLIHDEKITGALFPGTRRADLRSALESPDGSGIHLLLREVFRIHLTNSPDLGWLVGDRDQVGAVLAEILMRDAVRHILKAKTELRLNPGIRQSFLDLSTQWADEVTQESESNPPIVRLFDGLFFHGNEEALPRLFDNIRLAGTLLSRPQQSTKVKADTWFAGVIHFTLSTLDEGSKNGVEQLLAKLSLEKGKPFSERLRESLE